MNDMGVHELARLRFSRIISAVKQEREMMKADRRFCFISGAQWEGSIGDQYADRPKFEVNKVNASVMRIINEYRNNRITVDFTPKDGIRNDALADFLDGAYRASEYDSGADEAYDNAFEEGTSGGLGAWRLVTEYEDDCDPENEHQVVRFEPIFDADQSVYFDLDAKRQDKRDAKFCFVISSMTRDAYRDEYGDFDTTSWPVDNYQPRFDWYTPDVVYIAEYFVVDDENYKLHIYADSEGEEYKYSAGDFEDDPDLHVKLESEGKTKVRERTIKKQIVNKYVMSGGEILKDKQRLAGNYIPIVPFFGQRHFVDNQERIKGHVRLAKDPQRLKNIQLSKLGEISILSSVEKPILTPDQVAGHESRWADDNLNNYPYMLINPTIDEQGNEIKQGPLAYTKPPVVPPALAALLQLTESDMQDVLGNQAAGEELKANVSGVAVDLIQTRLDMQTAIYATNMRKAVRRSGEIWLSIIKEIYYERGRKVKLLGSQGEKSGVELGRKTLDEKTGEIVDEIDLSNANCDVNVEIGPASSTRRKATVKSLLGIMSVNKDPETAAILMNTIMMNAEGEGMGEMRKFFRKKLVAVGAVTPNEEEEKEIEEAKAQEANQGPTPEENYLAAESEKSEALAQKAASETDLAVAKTKTEEAKADKTEAETLDILAGIEGGDVDRAVAMAREIDSAQERKEQREFDRQALPAPAK